MQRPNHIARAQSSWLAQRIPKKRIGAILNLLSLKDEVLGLSGTDNKAELRRSCNALTEDILRLHGIPRKQLELEFAAAERYCNDPRNSMVSSSGSTVSQSSIFSQSSTRSSLSSVLTQYSGQLTIKPRFFCPTCGKDYGRAHDLKEHMLEKCEKDRQYKCLDCGSVEETRDRMREHVKEHNRLDSGFSEMMLPPKNFFGCPHCESTLETFLQYHDHLVDKHYRDEKLTNRGSPSRRVRAGIRGAGLETAVQQRCGALGLPMNGWKLFEWDDANAEWFWDRLEYGVRDADDDEYRNLGIEEIASFIAKMIQLADRSRCNYLLGTTSFDNSEMIQPPAAAAPLPLSGESPPTFSGPSTPMTIPPAAYHPRVERLRHEHGHAIRSGPPPSSTRYAQQAQLRNELTPAPGQATMPSHKHNLSEGSSDHPDGAERSRNSPAPARHAVDSPDMAASWVEPELQGYGYANGYDGAFTTWLDDSDISNYAFNQQPKSQFDWD